MSSLSSDEEFRKSLLSFSAVLTLCFGGIQISLLTPCYVQYHTTAILNLQPRGFIASHDAYRTFVIAYMTKGYFDISSGYFFNKIERIVR